MLPASGLIPLFENAPKSDGSVLDGISAGSSVGVSAGVLVAAGGGTGTAGDVDCTCLEHADKRRRNTNKIRFVRWRFIRR